MSNESKKVGITIVLNRAALNEAEQKDFLERLAEIAGTTYEELAEGATFTQVDKKVIPEPKA